MEFWRIPLQVKTVVFRSMLSCQVFLKPVAGGRWLEATSPGTVSVSRFAAESSTTAERGAALDETDDPP
ncbi:MAG TPA: hypothetical protein PLR25_05480 [Planctomycetaceae bacterium]|nr:hypothetical protein [Planctomycetaceae bacterium]